MADKADLLVICGPTATGKTKAAVNAAKHFNGEIICADSMQIYSELSVGTAKVTKEETQGVVHHIVDFLHPAQIFSVADYSKMAHECIKDITSRNKLPIMVGGTGQYIESVVKGITYSSQKTDAQIRSKLQYDLKNKGAEFLYARLCEIDSEYAKKIHINNHVRIIRALELYEQTGKTMTWQLKNSLPEQRPYNDVIIALNYEPRNFLYERINMRVDIMMKKGLLKEAKFVYDNKDTFITAAQAIGYKEFFDFFSGRCSIEECSEKLKQSSRNYAKRQLTWFKRMEKINWINAQEQDVNEEIKSIFLKHKEN